MVNRIFNQILWNYPDLHDAVKAQVSVLCESVIQVIHDGNITRHRQTSEVVLLLFKCSTLLHYHYRDTTSDAFYPQLACCHDVLPRLSFTASCNSYKSLMASHTVCVGMEVALKCFAEDKGNKNN